RPRWCIFRRCARATWSTTASACCSSPRSSASPSRPPPATSRCWHGWGWSPPRALASGRTTSGTRPRSKRSRTGSERSCDDQDRDHLGVGTTGKAVLTRPAGSPEARRRDLELDRFAVVQDVQRGAVLRTELLELAVMERRPRRRQHLLMHWHGHQRPQLAEIVDRLRTLQPWRPGRHREDLDLPARKGERVARVEQPPADQVADVGDHRDVWVDDGVIATRHPHADAGDLELVPVVDALPIHPGLAQRPGPPLVADDPDALVAVEQPTEPLDVEMV